MFGIKFENQNVENIKNTWALLIKKIVRRAFDLKRRSHRIIQAKN